MPYCHVLLKWELSVKLIHSPHLLVRATSERRVPALVATNGSHTKIALKVPPAGRNRSLVACTSRCGEFIRGWRQLPE